MQDLTLVLVLILGLALLVLSALTFHKARRTHLASFQLLARTEATQQEVNTLYRQLECLMALERRLALQVPLPKLRGWAGSPDFLLEVTDKLLGSDIRTVIECSSGVSTIVIARCLQLNGAGHVFSLEHDIEYAEKTRRLLDRHNLKSWATVLDAPLVAQEDGAKWYSLANVPRDMQHAELLVVDGPPHHIAPQARYPALPKLMPYLSPSMAVYLDDASRDDEQEIVRRWLHRYPDLKSSFIDCEKGLAVLTSTPAAART